MNVALWTFFLLLANPLQAKRLSKADRQSVEKLGLEYLKADNHENAVKLFNLVVEHQPHNTNTRCNLAVALMRMGNGPKTRVEWERLYTQAIRQYRVALAIDPTLNLAVEGMALTKSNVRLRMDLVGGALEEAERLIARALGEADPYAADKGESGAMAADRGGEKYLPHRGCVHHPRTQRSSHRLIPLPLPLSLSLPLPPPPPPTTNSLFRSLAHILFTSSHLYPTTARPRENGEAQDAKEELDAAQEA